MKTKNILLTGAAGTVGIEVLKQLVNQKDKFNITVFEIQNKDTEKKLRPFIKYINIIYGDITENTEVKNACLNQDYVIHLASLIPPKADDFPQLAHKVNVIGTQNLISNLEQFSPHTFLLNSSSISVYGDRIKNPWIKVTDPLSPSPKDEYAQTKIEAERIIFQSKLNWSIFRLTAIMGKHKISKLMFHMPLNTPLEICTPDIAAKAFVLALEKTNWISKNIYNLGGGPEYRTTYKEFLTRSFDIYGLGKLNFPNKTFAEKNFHCGYYQDNDKLERILHFQKGNLEEYYQNINKTTNQFIVGISKILNPIIKFCLFKRSEPYWAFTKNQSMKKHFFYTFLFFIFFANNAFSQSNEMIVNVSNIKEKKGFIVIALYKDAKDWLKHTKVYKTIRIKVDKNQVQATIPNLPAGNYAITLYHDENSNNDCDMNSIGIPIEKIGFSNIHKTILLKPSFKECQIQFPNTKEINIHLIALNPF